MAVVSPIRISATAAWGRLNEELVSLPGKLNSARYQAVKRTADQGRRMIADRFIEQYPKIQRGKIESGDPTKRKRPIISRVTKGKDPSGVITVTEQPIPMIAFRPKGAGMRIPSKGKPGGITVSMAKNKPPLKLRHAFRAVTKSGHEGVFLRRRGVKRLVVTQAANKAAAAITGGQVAGRLPIVELFGPNVYSLMNVPKVNAEVVGKLDALLAKNIQSQIDRFKPTQRL
ncbi:MAG TPA: hypothetical protein VGE74_17915 [Gemmata sp.]